MSIGAVFDSTWCWDHAGVTGNVIAAGIELLLMPADNFFEVYLRFLISIPVRWLPTYTVTRALVRR